MSTTEYPNVFVVGDEAPPTGHELLVAAELRVLRIKAEARDQLAAELAGQAPPFDADLLVDVLARPAEPPHRVEGLIPSHAGTLIVAQRKTGKTTLELNLARALLLGGEFLGRFPVRPVAGTVALLNYEMGAAQLARWAHEAGVPAQRVFLVNLRGRRNPLGNAADRTHLAGLLRARDVESIICDPFGRAFVGRSQNDSGEVGGWLGDLDRWARGDCGVQDVILTAHAGWEGERTRGASALEDWADSIITLVRDKDGEQVRYLRAEGRDVSVDEDRLTFDPSTRSLALSRGGSRKAAAKLRAGEALVPEVVSAAQASPGLSGNKLAPALRVRGASFQKGDELKAAALAVERGLLDVVDGPRGAKLYYPNLTSPDVPRRPPLGHVTTSPDLPYRGEVGGGEVSEGIEPGEVEHDHTTNEPTTLPDDDEMLDDHQEPLWPDDPTDDPTEEDDPPAPAAPPTPAATAATTTPCTVCGRPLLLVVAGRTVCAARDAKHATARDAGAA